MEIALHPLIITSVLNTYSIIDLSVFLQWLSKELQQKKESKSLKQHQHCMYILFTCTPVVVFLKT